MTQNTPTPLAFDPFDVDEDTQVTCIDLPGQNMVCRRRKQHLRIVLRKHRDVIFNLKLSPGASYTLEADKSPMYSPRDKLYIPSGQRITFQDGEQLHVWLSRNFSGKLILRHNGKLMSEYEPNTMDPHTVRSEHPQDKPAPLIVNMCVDPASAAAAPKVPNVNLTQDTMQAIEDYRSNLVKEAQANIQYVHVHEIKETTVSVPEIILQFFENGGDSTAIDSSGVMTRNWIISQIVGVGMDVVDKRKLMAELKNVSMRITRNMTKAGERFYIVFKGSPRLREILDAPRYAVDNAKVLDLTFGALSAQGLRHAAWDNVRGAYGIKSLGGKLCVAFMIGIDIAEWLRDYEQIDPVTGKRKRDITDLFVQIGVDLVKLGITTAITTTIIAGIMTVLLSATAVTGMLALGVIIGTIFISAGIGYALDRADKYFGISEKLKKTTKDVLEHLTEKHTHDYSNYELKSNF